MAKKVKVEGANLKAKVGGKNKKFPAKKMQKAVTKAAKMPLEEMD